MQIKPTPGSHMTNTKVNYSTDRTKLIHLFSLEIYVCIIFNPLQISISWYAFGSNPSPEAVWMCQSGWHIWAPHFCSILPAGQLNFGQAVQGSGLYSSVLIQPQILDVLRSELWLGHSITFTLWSLNLICAGFSQIFFCLHVPVYLYKLCRAADEKHPHTMTLIPLQVSGIKYPQDGSKVIIASFRNQEPWPTVSTG